MGTFHDDCGELHGITVVVETRGPQVYVGRFDRIEAESVLLQDVDLHAEGEDGVSNEEYIKKAARFGVWKRQASLSVPVAEVTALRPLADHQAGPPGTPAPAPMPTSTQAAGPGTEELVTITPSAREEALRLLSAEPPGSGLRLAVKGGGCSGLAYGLSFDTRREDDVIIPGGAFEVLLDRKSSIYLRGITLDHQGGLAGKGFVFINPNASNTCGCGESFSI